MKKLESKNIKDIYEGRVARTYDMSMSHFFARFKEKAFMEANLKNGDTVLVFCCGTGLDFLPILKKIGEQGKIIGIDFSTKMLSIAEKRIQKNKWQNIELINADITEFEIYLNEPADAGVCTLGMSIIPDFRSAYSNLLANVKSNGEIIIGDMQLASGWQSNLNPITLTLANKYGGIREGHKNSLELQLMMEKDLMNFKKETFFLGAYYNCTGRKNE